VVGYVYKVLVEVLVMPVTYAVIGWLKRREPTYGEAAVAGDALAPLR
jgi:queuosine precursor transporter